MHDVLRQRLIRKIESLPDEQVYQVLDYIEFLESKYVTAEGVTTSGLQKFAEGLEDKLRRRAVSPNTIREAFQLISAADRVLSGVSSAGRQILGDLGQALEVEEGGPPPQEPEGEAQTFEADPRKRRASSGRTPPPQAPEATSDGPEGRRSSATMDGSGARSGTIDPSAGHDDDASGGAGSDTGGASGS